MYLFPHAWYFFPFFGSVCAPLCCKLVMCVLVLHGWAWSWRQQIPEFARTGHAANASLGHNLLRLQSPYTGVSTSPSPETPKKSQKGLPGPPGLERQKSVEKSQIRRLQNQCSGTFRYFFDTPGREAREVLFETFWGFRGSGVWRLLYMGIAIARHVESTQAVFLLFGGNFPIFWAQAEKCGTL